VAALITNPRDGAKESDMADKGQDKKVSDDALNKVAGGTITRNPPPEKRVSDQALDKVAGGVAGRTPPPQKRVTDEDLNKAAGGAGGVTPGKKWPG
jgi:hypothetical protein